MLVVTAGITLLAMVLLFFAARREITVCELEIGRGNIVVVRGGISPSVLSDLRDVVRRLRLKQGSVRIVRAKERARVICSSDIPRDAAQTIRNVVGNLTLAKLLAGADVAKPRKRKA